jgi:hypothetical protein
LTTVTATAGSVTVNASDTSADTATSALNVVATNTNNESDIVALLDQLFTTSYAYTSASGWQNLNTGDEVLDDSDPNAPVIYKYTGSGELDDLSTEAFTTGWQKQTEGEPTAAGELAAFNQYNLGDERSAVANDRDCHWSLAHRRHRHRRRRQRVGRDHRIRRE